MTGVRLQAGLEIGRILGAMDTLRSIAKSPAPVLRAIGPGLVATTHDRFDEAREPYGAPWAALSPAYAALKRGPGILRESGMRGGLMGSITFQVAGSELHVGSNKVYAAIHQFGGVIKPVSARALRFGLMIGGKRAVVRVHSVRIPARPYLGFGPADYRVVMDVLEAWTGRALR